ncbi:MAG: hypothetical protein R3Y22_06480 [Bacteroidales bacterium]
MKKNIFHIFLFIILLIISDNICGYCLDTINQYAFEKNPTANKIPYSFEKVNSDIVIVGSSRASHHYIPSMITDSLNLSAYNCGFDGMFLLYQTCNIDALLKRYKPKMIIWDISSPAILNTSKDEIEINRITNRLGNYYNQNQYTDSILQSASKLEWIKLECSLYRYNSYIIQLAGKLIAPKVNKQLGYIPLSDTGYNFSKIKKTHINDTFSNERANLFINTINKCIDNDVKIIIIFSPALLETNYRETNSYKKIIEICDKKNITILDYYHNYYFMNDASLFKDHVHLNNKGATIFTNEIIKELKSDSTIVL